MKHRNQPRTLRSDRSRSRSAHPAREQMRRSSSSASRSRQSREADGVQSRRSPHQKNMASSRRKDTAKRDRHVVPSTTSSRRHAVNVRRSLRAQSRRKHSDLQASLFQYADPDQLHSALQASNELLQRKRARRTLKKRQRRRRRFATLVTFFGIILLAGWTFQWLQRSFFTASIPPQTLRLKAHQVVLDHLRVSDTSKRALSRAEKEADLHTLESWLNIVQPLTSEQQSAWEEQKKTLLASTEDPDFANGLKETLSSFDAPIRLLDVPAYASLRATLGSELLEDQSPYALALQSPRTIDRYLRWATGENTSILSSALAVQPRNAATDAALDESSEGKKATEQSSTTDTKAQNSASSAVQNTASSQDIAASSLSSDAVESGKESSATSDSTLESRPKEAALVNAALPRIEQTFQALLPSLDAPTLQMDRSKQIAVLSGLRFEDRAISAHRETLQSYLQNDSTGQTLILDLRGCQGTSDMYWMETLLPYLSDHSATLQVQIAFPQGFATYMNYLSLDEKLKFFDLEDTRQNFPRDLPSHTREGLENRQYIKTMSLSSLASDQRVPKRAIYLLVDQNTGGAAETFALFCKENALAEVAGTLTKGTGATPPPFLLALPHSGLLVELQVATPLTQDGQSLFTESGVTPTITLQGEDLLQALFVLLKQ